MIFFGLVLVLFISAIFLLTKVKKNIFPHAGIQEDTIEKPRKKPPQKPMRQQSLSQIEKQYLDTSLDHHRMGFSLDKKDLLISTEFIQKIAPDENKELRTPRIKKLLNQEKLSLKKMWIIHEIFKAPYLDR